MITHGQLTSLCGATMKAGCRAWFLGSAHMPYRLFTPERLEAGRKCGSGSDNVKQLEDANVYGALVCATGSA